MINANPKTTMSKKTKEETNEAKAREKEAKDREKEAKDREKEAKVREANEAKVREKEAKVREREAKAREVKEAKYREKEAKAREVKEAKDREKEAKAREKEAKVREAKEANVDNVDNVDNIVVLVKRLTENYTQIMSIEALKKHKKLSWGGNGIGDRWAGKKLNYSVIYSNKTIKKYSENDTDEIPIDILESFFIKLKQNKNNGIIGIFAHSLRKNIVNRPIREDIKKSICSNSCVVCGSKSDIICDHKNDIYNDKRVLKTTTQVISDFQALCNHCNLQKRQIFKEETKNNKVYSAKNIPMYSLYNFEFPWEKKAFDKNDVYCKIDTFWYDPIEFERKKEMYIRVTIPINNRIKKTVVVIE